MTPQDIAILIIAVLVVVLLVWVGRMSAIPSTSLLDPTWPKPPMPPCHPPRPRQRTSEDYARDELEVLHDFLVATIDNEWSVEQAVAFSRAQLDLVEAELKKPRIPQPPAPPGPRTMGH